MGGRTRKNNTFIKIHYKAGGIIDLEAIAVNDI